MGILDTLLANKTLQVAHRLAPVVSASILSAYVLSGKRMSIILGEGGTQKDVVAAHKELNSRADKFFNIGGG